MSLSSRIGTIIVVCICLFFKLSVYALPPMNLPYGVTPISHQVYDLHMASFYICVGIGAVVFGVMIYTLIRFRKSKGAVAANFHEHLGIELLWTIIPFIILVVMAVPATILLIHIHDTKKPDLDVKITGYQWKWKYDYLDQGISFFSDLSTPISEVDDRKPKDKWYLLEVDHPLVLPIKEKIRFLVTSNDVIHSWWVPDLGIKQDAIPGYINQIWTYIDKPGTYRGQCAELCGAFHGFMPIVVKAVTRQEFKKWIESQEKKLGRQVAASQEHLSKEQLMTLGKAAYGQNCAICHQSNGEGTPPAFPAIKGSKVATGPLKKHIDIVLNGVQGTAMQAFGKQLDDKTLAAIITYQRNAWGNADLNRKQNHVTVVEPSDVKKEHE